MSGRSGRDRVIGGRLLPAAVLAVVVFVGLALVWSGLASARAQDQAKWWSGPSKMVPCDEALGEFLDSVERNEVTGRECHFNRENSARPEKRARYALSLIEKDGRKLLQLTAWAEVVCFGLGCHFGYSDGWDKISCDDAEGIKADILKAINYPHTPGKASCEYYSDKRLQSLVMTFEPKVAAAAQACDKTTFLGPWKNANAKYAKYAGAGVTFEKSMISGEVTGRFKLQKESHNTQFILGNVISTVGPPKGCLFTANLDSSMQLREGLKYDKATDSFTITMADGSPNPGFPGRWTRGAPPKPAATCSKDDINGTWHRADGARVLMTGVGVFGNGGHGIMERYPEDRWPKGETKFSGVKEVGQCRYEASCTSIARRTTNGVASYGVDRAACTLTLDPVKRTLSATGGSGLFSRVAPASSADADARAEAAAAKARETATEAERTARLNREVAERDAAIKRRNAEIKAADERRQREYRDALARQKAETERIKREDAAAKARYEAEMAAWRARVAACNAGDYSKCQ